MPKRLPASELPLYINVKKYGALGDGVTDDTAAIQAAIDEAAGVRGGVFFPPGDYRFTQLLYKPYVHLVGVGHGSKLIWTSPNPDGGLVPANWYGSKNYTLNVRITNLHMSVASDWSDTNAYPILFMYFCIDFFLSNLWFSASQKVVTCLKATKTYQGQVVNLVVDGAWHGIRSVVGSETFGLRNTDFVNVFLYQCDGIALGLNDAADNSFSNLRLINDSARSAGNATGIYGSSTMQNNRFSNVFIRSIDGYGMNLEGASGNTFVNLRVHGCTRHNIVVQGPDNAFHSVLTTGSQQSGLVFQSGNAARNRIHGLRTADNTLKGVQASDSALPTGESANEIHGITESGNQQASDLDTNRLLVVGPTRRSPVIRSAAAAVTYATRLDGDSFDRFALRADGRMDLGAGTSAPDTTLYRQSANVLATDDRLVAVDGLTTKTKADAPTDADFSSPPADGTLVVDTTNNRLYVRIGGAWKSVALV
jgi:hypothetical protein